MAKERRTGSAKPSAPVMIILGSESDRPVIEGMPVLFEQFGIEFEVAVASAHRQPERLRRLIAGGKRGGVKVYIAVAGMAAHLPGVVASLTIRPVIGVPVAAGALAGVDALLSISQMPPGVPVAAVAIGSAGARNAAILAARILALTDPHISSRLEAYRKDLAKGRK